MLEAGIAGDVSEALPTLSERRRRKSETKKTTPRGGVGDAASVMLNAAALQTLSMKQAGADGIPDYRVYRGRIITNNPSNRQLLQGVSSNDVSYIADAAPQAPTRTRSSTDAAGSGAAGSGSESRGWTCRRRCMRTTRSLCPGCRTCCDAVTL